MAGITGSLTAQTVQMLTSGTTGANVRVAAIAANDSSLSATQIKSITQLNATVDMMEAQGIAQYPALLVYCGRSRNLMTEKGREFSGQVEITVEVRHSQDKLTSIDQNTQLYVDAVCALLDDSRGDWGDGTMYTGGYEVHYEPVLKGGRNFVQKVKVNFTLEVSD